MDRGPCTTVIDTYTTGYVVTLVYTGHCSRSRWTHWEAQADMVMRREFAFPNRTTLTRYQTTPALSTLHTMVTAPCSRIWLILHYSERACAPSRSSWHAPYLHTHSERARTIIQSGSPSLHATACLWLRLCPPIDESLRMCDNGAWLHRHCVTRWTTSNSSSAFAGTAHNATSRTPLPYRTCEAGSCASCGL